MYMHSTPWYNHLKPTYHNYSVISFGQICARFPAHYPHLSLVDGLDHESVKTLFFNSIHFFGMIPTFHPITWLTKPHIAAAEDWPLPQSSTGHSPPRSSGRMPWSTSIRALLLLLLLCLKKNLERGPRIQDQRGSREGVHEWNHHMWHGDQQPLRWMEQHRQLKFPGPSRIPRRQWSHWQLPLGASSALRPGTRPCCRMPRHSVNGEQPDHSAVCGSNVQRNRQWTMVCCGTEFGAGRLSGHQWVPVIPNEIAHKELKRADFVVPPLTRFRCKSCCIWYSLGVVLVKVFGSIYGMAWKWATR